MEGIPFWGVPFYAGVVARSPFIHDFYRDVVNEVCAHPSTQRILDIGTGPGHIPIQLAGRLPEADIDGIDISPAMVDTAIANAVTAGLLRRAHFRYGSAEKIPFTENCFDLVLATLTLHHWARVENCLKEVLRVLVPGGELWVYEIKKDVTLENRQQLKQKYGAFLSFMILNFVRAHSSVTSKQIEKVKSYTSLGFSKVTAEDRGMFVKLTLVK